jgi:hypothetical protein
MLKVTCLGPFTTEQFAAALSCASASYAAFANPAPGLSLSIPFLHAMDFKDDILLHEIIFQKKHCQLTGTFFILFYVTHFTSN